MAKHRLTDRTVRAAKGKGKPYRLDDGDGLYLFIAPTGVKSWQFRYRLGGKQQTATLGKLNVLSLAEARTAADHARKEAAKGVQLTQAKHIAKARRQADTANTFKAVAAAWMKSEARRKRWTPDYRQEIKASIENHLSALGALPVSEIRAAIAAPALRRLERTAPAMEAKVHARLNAILDYAVEQGVLDINPLPGRRARKLQVDHFPAVLTHDGVGAILRAADAADPCRGIQRAHALLIFTAQRIGEIVPARWDEFDLTAGTWSIPRARMKRRDTERGPHGVPLPAYLLKLVTDWRRVDGPGAEFMCPAPRGGGHVTREAVEKFYRRTLALANEHSPHAWRSVFSTWSRDAGKDGDAVEAQLDHVVGGKVQAAYDRAARLERRRELMEWYADMLIAARDGAKVVKLDERRA